MTHLRVSEGADRGQQARRVTSGDESERATIAPQGVHRSAYRMHPLGAPKHQRGGSNSSRNATGGASEYAGTTKLRQHARSTRAGELTDPFEGSLTHPSDTRKGSSSRAPASRFSSPPDASERVRAEALSVVLSSRRLAPAHGRRRRPYRAAGGHNDGGEVPVDKWNGARVSVR